VLGLKQRIVIAGLVNRNSACVNDEDRCWRAACGAFEELGTYKSYSEVAEYQLGVQVGTENFAMTSNKVWAKRRGKTIKETNLEAHDDMLVPFLDCYWAVRVSYCTGVAERVQLRELVADLLPAFTKALTNRTIVSQWEELCGRYRAIETFRESDPAHTDLHKWLRRLPEELHRLVLGLVRQIFHTLKHTGLSPDNTYFSVAWPHNGIVNRCFRIPLDDYNRWTPMLADSDDCATFAYMTAAHCLEAGQFRCRGPNPTWLNRINLGETAGLCPAPPRSGTWTLNSGQTYFFRKLDENLFWVKAQRDPLHATAPAMLVRMVFIESLPRDVRYRLLVKESRRQGRRVRAKDLPFVEAEVVPVSSAQA